MAGPYYPVVSETVSVNIFPEQDIPRFSLASRSDALECAARPRFSRHRRVVLRTESGPAGGGVNVKLAPRVAGPPHSKLAILQIAKCRGTVVTTSCRPRPSKTGECPGSRNRSRVCATPEKLIEWGKRLCTRRTNPSLRLRSNPKTMIKSLIKFLLRLAILLAFVLMVLLCGELLRFYILMYRIRPLFAEIYAYTVAFGLLGLLLYTLWLLRRHPPLPRPPIVTGRESDHVRMRRYCRYLVDYLHHLAANPNLEADRRGTVLEGVRQVRGALAAHPLNEDLARTILKTEEQVLLPALASLNELASAEVRRCVRDVMLGVTLSPYQALDLIVVLYRNLAMTNRLVRLYHGRPSVGDSWRILRDILVTVATVNALNLSRKLFASLLSEVPLLGRVVEGIGQGLGAGLMTSITGHTAMDRCTAFRGWNTEEETRSLAYRMAGFLADVRDLFTKDLLPQLKGMIRAGTQPGVADQPGFWDSVARGVGTAVDLTARVADTLILQPVVAVGTGVVQAGTYLGRGAIQAGQTAVRVTRKRVRRAGGGAGRVLRTFGQRLYYLFRAPRFFE